MSTYTRWTRWAVGAAGVMGLLLMLGACGGGPPGAVAPPQPQAPAAPAQPALAAPAAEPQPAPAAPQTARVQPAPGPTTPASAALKPQFGGVLQHLSRLWASCFYWFAQSCIGASRVTITAPALPMFEGLIDFEYQQPGIDPRGVGKLAGALAESWKQVDERTWEFTLRKGVKFHDGAELTSKDVVWSLQRWGDSTSDPTLRTYASNFAKVEPTGPYGVRLTLKQVTPYSINTLANTGYMILPAHPAEQAGSPTGEALKSIYGKNPIGTGPFKLRSLDPNRLEMERHEGYWKHRPYLDGIRVLFARDDATWQAAFATGKADYITLQDKVQADQVVRRVPDATVFNYDASSSGLVFNQQRKPFDDFRVRRALQLAVDLQALVQAVTFGQGFIAAPVMYPSLTRGGRGVQPSEYLQWPGYRQPKTADIAEAKRLLAEAGIPPGFKIVIPYFGGAPQPAAFAGPVAGQLRTALGLDVTAQGMESAVYVAQIQQARDFGVALHSQVGANLDAPADGMYQFWHTQGASNFFGVNDPGLNRLVEAALKEFDSSKRNELYKQVQRRLWDNAYVVMIPTVQTYMLVQPWVYEFYGSASVNPSLSNSAAYWLAVDKLPADRRGGW